MAVNQTKSIAATAGIIRMRFDDIIFNYRRKTKIVIRAIHH